MSESQVDIIRLRAQLWAQLEVLGDPRTVTSALDNPILDTDSYKLCHQAMYGKIGVTRAAAYIEPRIKNTTMVFVGTNMWTKRFKPITHFMVDQAKEFFTNHIIGGGEMFPEADWRRVVDEFGGYPPLKIHALREGSVVPSQNMMAYIECDVPGLAWMASYFETAILRAIWYPTTVATKSYEIRQRLRQFAEKSSDMNIADAVAFMYHDFGARGVSSKESAAIGGAAHILAGSLGTDTISGAVLANEVYNTQMSAYSVFATEHSIMTMRGREGELQTVEDVIRTYERGAGSIVSMVSDGYDIYNLANHICTTFKPLILEKGIRMVVRPDSGDAVEVILKLLKMFDESYGSVVNSKGYKVLNVIRILQGDGLSELEDFEAISETVLGAGFSIENLVFGQGGGLLQMVNRDRYKFAMKTCAAEINGEWVDVFKDPITDPGKRSKRGQLATVRRQGQVLTVRTEDMLPSDENLMVLVWDSGVQLVEETVTSIQQRTLNPL